MKGLIAPLIAVWDDKERRYVMTGHKIAIGKATVEAGKVKVKQSTYRAKQKKMQAQRDQGRWLRKAKKP